MPSQSIALLSQTSTVGEFASTSLAKGDGYYNIGDGLHTAVFTFEGFEGEVRLEATLALSPTEADWFTIDNTTVTASNLTGSQFVNFYGNFVWIRAKGTLVSGSISQIRYNH
jgi:hypothetical protein